MGALTRNSLSRPPWNELMTWVRPTDIMEALRRMSKRLDILPGWHHQRRRVTVRFRGAA